MIPNLAFRRPRVGCTALSFALLALAGTPRQVFAQQASAAPSEEGEAERRRTVARAKYEQGADAYAAGHYADAVEAFLAADHLMPSAPLSFNIARAQEKLGNVAGALRWYRDYLRRSPKAGNAPSVRASIAALAQALAKSGLQQVTVLSTPEGAHVEIDSQSPAATPWTGELAPGRHHLVFTRPDYADAQRDIDLNVNEPLELNVELTPKSSVVSSDARANVATNTASPVTSPVKSTARDHRFGVLPWVSLGVGAAALGGALTFELMRRSAETDAEHASQLDYRAEYDREQSRQTASRVFLGVGGAFIVAGGVMLLLDTKPQSHFAGAGLMCLPQSCAATALGRF